VLILKGWKNKCLRACLGTQCMTSISLIEGNFSLDCFPSRFLAIGSHAYVICVKTLQKQNTDVCLLIYGYLIFHGSARLYLCSEINGAPWNMSRSCCTHMYYSNMVNTLLLLLDKWGIVGTIFYCINIFLFHLFFLRAHHKNC
jgi:hypothetical protein